MECVPLTVTDLPRSDTVKIAIYTKFVLMQFCNVQLSDFGDHNWVNLDAAINASVKIQWNPVIMQDWKYTSRQLSNEFGDAVGAGDEVTFLLFLEVVVQEGYENGAETPFIA